MNPLGQSDTGPTHFGALLKRYRQSARLSQEGLAERAGLSARAISDLERGVNRTPRYATLEALATALALSAPQRDLLQAAAQPDLTSDAPSLSFLNVPSPPTPLIGRGEERARAAALLQGDARLLTLTGSSGVGKTRLALELARDLAPAFGDGVVFVSLAPVRDPSLVAGAIAQRLGLGRSVGSAPAARVEEFLSAKRLLLVLDNFEQVQESASFIANLLETCPRIAIMVTSRMPLHLRAEHMLQVAPLPIEDAVKLFSERAASVRADEDFEASDLTAICEQLDRVPLAIELAARHVKILAVPELRKRLAHRLEFLRGGAGDLPARQQTMEDAIAWSYELLTESQQRSIRALGVFTGGWTLEGAEAVCAGGPPSEETIATLAALVDASLVQTETVASGVIRFHMLELIREFALDRLRDAGEGESSRRRHAVYFASLAERALALFGPGQDISNAPLTLEFPNVRAALQWAEVNREPGLGLRLTGFARLWYVTGQPGEAEQWLEKMLAIDLEAREPGGEAAPLSLRIERLNSLARILLGLGELDRAQAFAEQALEFAERSRDERALGSTWAGLGYIAHANGNLDRAARAFTEASFHADLARDPELQNQALVDLAEVARRQGDLGRARKLLEKALADTQTRDERWSRAMITTLLGHVAREQRDYRLAEARYREALALLRAFGSPTFMAWCLEGYAAAIAAEGQAARAAHLLAAAAGLRERAGTPPPPSEREALEQVIAATKKALGDAKFAQEWARGSAMPADEWGES
jgi:predicted ATPase/transcriptional regulator with XRE-family HTH domain